MRARMRELLARQLRVLTEARLLVAPTGYLVDGSIDSFTAVMGYMRARPPCISLPISAGNRCWPS